MADKVDHLLRDKVFIQGPGPLNFMRMFIRAGFKGTRNIDEADIVCFTGGPDIDPALYEEKPLNETRFDLKRDDDDLEAFKRAFQRGTYMVGVCRGAQFLNVMNEGWLWQDVNNHRRDHSIIDLESKKEILVTSTHHQQMIPREDALILADCSVATSKKREGVTWSKLAIGHNIEAEQDVEACFYEETQCLCFQPHPEWDSPRYKPCEEYFIELLERTGDFICAA